MAHHLFTSESVTEGHPDKICDQISDAILDAILAQDPNGRVACECTVTTGVVNVMGEITTDCYVDIPKVVRQTVREIGYDRAKYGFDCETCAVITNIGLDHTEILGDTLEQIAREKAGILKPGTRAVSYPQTPEVRAVLHEICAQRGIPLTEADAAAIVSLTDGVDGQTFTYRGAEYTLPLLGAHQLRNAAVALETVTALRARGWRIPDAAVRAGLAQVRWSARFELLRRAPWFVLDGGHNPQCAQTVADNLARYFPGRRITLLVGVLADKDYPAMLAALDGQAAAYIAATPLSPRALPAAELGDYLKRFGKPVTVCADPAQAAELALAHAAPEDVICAVGSLYMAGAIRMDLRRDHNENSGH